MKRTACYMRVSTSRQAEEGDSIPAQRAALRKYIDDHDDMIFAGEYLDDGISGTKADRDEYQRLLADIQDKKIDLVLCTKLDRLHRGLRNFLNMQDIMEKSGCNWLAIWEPMYDSSTPQGKMIINTMVNLAQFEAENTGQRIRQVMAYKVAKGEIVTGMLPYGYKAEDKRLVPNEKAGNVKALFEHFAETNCLRETARFARDNLGYPISYSHLKELLQNPKYIGRWRGNMNYCPPLVGIDLWERVQTALPRNVRVNSGRVYIFSGLVVCAHCGARMEVNHTSPKGKSYIHYRCRIRYGSTGRTCENNRRTNEESLETVLVPSVRQRVERESRRVDLDVRKAADTTAQRKRLEKRLVRLREMCLDELLTLDEYKTEKAKIEAELANLEVAEPARDYSGIIALIGDDLEVRYQTWTREERRHFWRQIIKEIRIDKDRNLTVEFL